MSAPCGQHEPGSPAHVICQREAEHSMPHRWENEYATWEWEPTDVPAREKVARLLESKYGAEVDPLDHFPGAWLADADEILELLDGVQ